MEAQLSIPGLFFSATAIIVLATTTRFFSWTSYLRKLQMEYEREPSADLAQEIHAIGRRLKYTKWSNLLCIFSMFFSVISVLFYYLEMAYWGDQSMAAAFVAMMLSLAAGALDIIQTVDHWQDTLEE